MEVLWVKYVKPLHKLLLVYFDTDIYNKFLDKGRSNISYRTEVLYALHLKQGSWTLGKIYIFPIPDIKPANASKLIEIAKRWD
jgi:hypothetical protein